MPIALTTLRNTLVHSRLGWPEVTATKVQASEPTRKTRNPHPVTRAPRFEAVITEAIIVAAGATQPANCSTRIYSNQKDQGYATALGCVLGFARLRGSKKTDPVSWKPP